MKSIAARYDGRLGAERVVHRSVRSRPAMPRPEAAREWELALSGSPGLHLCLSACGLGRPGSMKPNCVASRTTTNSILDDVAALASIKDPETEAWQSVVPDQVVLFLGFRRLDDPLRNFDDDIPSFRARSLA